MHKTALLILLVMAYLASGLVISPESFSPGHLLQVFASMYAPSNPEKNDRVMTFGRELIPATTVERIPQQTYFK